MSIAEFTYKDQYDSLSDAVEGGINGNPYTFAMNNSEYTISGGAIAAIYNRVNQLGRRGIATTNARKWASGEGDGEPLADASNLFGEAIFNASIGAVRNIADYMVPSSLALDTFDELGKQIDELIEESFSMQAFALKGTDITCAIFCVLMSFLSCSERNQLYENIEAIKAQSLGLAKASEAITEAAYIVNTTIATLGDAINGTNDLFSLGKKDKDTGTGAGGMAATLMAVPSALEATVDMFKKSIELINKAKVTMPVDINGSLWDYAQNALFLLQSMAVNIADEALSKITNPVEEKIKQMQPINCVGNLAAVFFNKLLDSVKLFKQWILKLIADIFAESKAFNIQFKTFNVHLKYLLEISAFLEALHLVLSRFGDLAIACGVTPCTKDSSSPQRQGIPMIVSTGPSKIISGDLAITADTLDDLAEKLSPILNKSIADIIVTPEEIKTINRINNLPRKLANSIDSVAKELGSDYQIYLNNNNATIVHSFKRTCGV